MHARSVWRRGAVVMASVIATAGATLSTGPAAQAGPDGSGAALPQSSDKGQSSQSGAAGLTLDGVTPGPKTITLVTGDQVTLTPSGTQYGIDTEPAAIDGRMPRFITQAGPNGIYVLPDDAMPAITAGRLDRELFNVKYLAENGYTDADGAGLPVIVQYPANRGSVSVAAAAAALPASDPTLSLQSIHASALTVSKAKAGQFWATVRGTAPTTNGANGIAGTGLAAKSLGAGISKVWLDRKVTATLDQSVPQIGAPQAWAAGHDGSGVKVAILDSGIDLNHPDLQGKVVDQKSFVPGVESVQDGGGHGTHVASTITGTGAASGGKYKGVAPGVTLAIGKVLNDAGSGSLAQVVDGMEWAVGTGAKVVSMSLGACCSDGSDPASQAVDTLTAQTGALFVISAGNNGGSETINTPGSAGAALTVAAVSKTDTLASFSSRGPRPGGALKPDIAGPGVDIVAARSAGTSLGTPVNDYYTSLSGTSMAAPHVSGAAAILAQHHPDWTAPQLKAALMSTSKDDGYNAYEQGAGRVDLARADSQQVFATTANLDFGVVTSITESVDKQVTYTNLGDTAVTLTLEPALRNVKGNPEDARLTSDASVTVPAHGTATATVTFDPTDLEFGRYVGAVVATDDAAGIRVTAPVSVVREAPRYPLTVHTIGRDGSPADPFIQDVIDVTGDYGAIDGSTIIDPGTVLTMVPAGTYSVAQLFGWTDEDRRTNTAWLFNPEVTVTGATEITLDSRTATELQFTTPKPSEPVAHFFSSYYQRTTTANVHFERELKSVHGDRLWAAPTEPVTAGTFRFNVNQKLARSELAMNVTGKSGLTLHPIIEWHTGEGMAPQWVGSHPDFRHFQGTQDLPLVDVGLGRPEDIEGLDLRGKLVLMETDMAQGLFGPVCGVRIERIEPIRDAGAAGILAAPGADTPCTVPLYTVQEPLTGPLRPTSIPRASISPRESAALRAKLADGPVTVRVASAPESPYSYTLAPYEEGRVPDSLHYSFTAKQLAQVELDFQNVPSPKGTHYVDSIFALKRDQRVSDWTEIASPHTGTHRTEYVGPLSPDVVYQRIVTPKERGASEQQSQQGRVAYGDLLRFDRPVHIRQRWFADPMTPGAEIMAPELAPILDYERPNARLSTGCAMCRQGDRLWPGFFMTSINNGVTESDGFSTPQKAPIEDFRDFTVRLFHGDTEIPQSKLAVGFLSGFTLPAESGTYRLVADGPNTDVTWTFTSARPTESTTRTGYWCMEHLYNVSDDPCQPGGILFAGYDLGDSLDRDNAVAAGRQHRFQLNITQPQSTIQPNVAGAKLWASTDDGAHWTAVDLKRTGNGHYNARVKYPDFAKTTGNVSLKVEAWDTAGNRIEQTSMNAFALRSTKKPHSAQ